MKLALNSLVLLLAGMMPLRLPLMAAEQPARPNVLFVVSDDLNDYLGCYNDPRAQTPNLDKLAARGVLFERAYCTYPLCGPSRNSFLCGLYPNSTGIHQNAQIFRQTIPSHISLPHAFRNAGYFSARIGKLYHYGVPLGIGTSGHDDPASWELELNPAGCDRLEELPVTFSLIEGTFGGTPSWYASPKSDEFHTDGILAADADWVLQRCAKHPERPFFLAVGFFRPHTPYTAPKPYFDLYPREQIPIVQGVKEDLQDIPPIAANGKPKYAFTDDLQKECIQAYYASISFMDAQVGKVINALERLGLAENTIIIFTSDHGYHMGEHGQWQKMTLFEESARVPLMIVAPGVSQPGAVVHSPVSHIDIYPTLAELCQLDAPDTLQGQSLVPMLKNPSETGRGWALTQVMRRTKDKKQVFGYSLRTPRWRYTEWDEGRLGRELYDHDHDPSELTNLAEKPEFQEVVKMLSQQLQEIIPTTFPPDGVAPKWIDKPWYPNLTNP